MMLGQSKMMWVGVIVVLVVIIGAGVLLMMNNNTANNAATSSSNTSTSSKTFTLSEQNGSNQNGTVVLEEVGSKVQVTVSLSNPMAGAEPVHIHVGSCPTPGAVIFPLDDVVNGKSVTLIDTSFAELKAQGKIALNVHKSAAESSVYYACGDLAF